MSLIYLLRNGTSINKRLSLLDKQAYVFGSAIRLDPRPDNGPRSAFLAADEATESTFISNLLNDTTDAIVAQYQETSSKDPWPTPPASGKAPSANLSGITTKAGAESALAGTSSSTTTYRRIAIDDQSSPPTTSTIDLTSRGLFVFMGVIAFPVGLSLGLVADDSEASNISGWASSTGLTFTQLFDTANDPNKPNYPSPVFDLTKVPFAGAGAPPRRKRT